MNGPKRDLVRTVLAVVFIGLLIVSSLWILSPFVGAIVWATLIAVATWPFLRWLERRLWGKRALAVAVLTVLLLGVVMGPFLAALGAIVTHVDDFTAFAQRLPTYRLPAAPAWLVKVPLIGSKATGLWNSASEAGVPALLEEASPYLKKAVRWLVDHLGSVAVLFGQGLLTIIITAVMYATGETAVAGVRAFLRRLAGGQGDQVVDLAGGAIRAIAMGVVGTALVQSLFAGAGLLIAGVPFTGVLTVAMFVLAIAQIGPIPVLLVVVIWSYSALGPAWGTFLLVWSAVAGTIDNVLRPLLIKKGVDLPLLLIFAGVLGGLMSAGIVGIFVGPVVLAVTYTLVEDWVRRGDGDAAA